MPTRPPAPAHDAGYTVDPDADESALVLGRSPVYQEEAGIRPDKDSRVTLEPCPLCRAPTIAGATHNGSLVIVEPQTRTYALVWYSGERHPRAHQVRGYPEHVCRARGENS